MYYRFSIFFFEITRAPSSLDPCPREKVHRRERGARGNDAAPPRGPDSAGPLPYILSATCLVSHGCQELAIAGSQSRGEPERLIDHRFDWLRFRARTTGHRPVVVVVVVVAAVVPHPPHQPRTARVPEARIGSDQMLLLLLLLLLCR